MANISSIFIDISQFLKVPILNSLHEPIQLSTLTVLNGERIGVIFQINLIFKEFNPNDKSQFRYMATVDFDALRLRNELVQLLRAEIIQESCLKLGLSVGTAYPRIRQVVLEHCSQQLDVLINFTYEVEEGTCKATLNSVSLQPLEETTKEFVQKYLEKPDDEIIFTGSNEKRKIRYMRELEFILQTNRLGRYFELMDAIIEQVSLAFGELRNDVQFWRERHISLFQAENDAYPSVMGDNMRPYYKLIRDVFAEDHCYFTKIKQLIRWIHLGTQGNLDQTIIQSLDQSILQQRDLILQLNLPSHHHLITTPRKKGDKILFKVFLLSYLYRQMLTREQHTNCSLRYFGDLGNNHLSEIVEQWEKGVRGQALVKHYVSANSASILQEVQNYSMEMRTIDQRLFQDVLDIVRNFSQIKFYQKKFFQVWQNFVMSTWIGDFKVLLRIIFTYMRESLARVTAEKMEIHSHQEYFKIFWQVLFIMATTREISIVSHELQSYYWDMITHLQRMLEHVHISKQFKQSEKDKRTALLLVHVYVNLKLWSNHMPSVTVREVQKKIYTICMDYRRSAEEGIQQDQGDQRAFVNLGPVHEIHQELLVSDNQEETLRRIVGMIKDSYGQQKIIYDDIRIDDFVQIVIHLQETVDWQ